MDFVLTKWYLGHQNQKWIFCKHGATLKQNNIEIKNVINFNYILNNLQFEV